MLPPSAIIQKGGFSMTESSTMGMIIPPSTPMIVYSMISGASVGALFVAGAVPGILIALRYNC